jgi:methylglutaconyl-CoA hydratase
VRGDAQGLRETKRLVSRHLVERIDEHGPELAALSARLFGSDQARAAMRAFLDRRR